MAESKNDRRQALELAISQIERQFGKGSVMRLGAGGPLEEIAVIPTGALSLDAALGIGGLPRGRVTEIYGPESSGKTTLALHVISEAQRLGGIAAFIDAEHALDPIYARKLGVNTDELLISQPDTGEQALEIAETLVRSNAVDVIVIDSVAALVPRAELDGDMGDSLPGLQARLMSQALRKLTAAISRSGGVVIFINQIREKIGVMFGCFHYSTRVVLADGRREKIGKIVNQRMPVEVLSYDPTTGRIEPRRVVNWFDNGRADEFIQFEVEGGRSGYRHFAATENHVVFTPKGQVRAGALMAGDEVLLSVEDYRLTDDQVQVVLGGGLGDGSIRKVGAHTAHFRVGHARAQKDYLCWKQEMLSPFAGAIRPTGNGLGFDTVAMPTLFDAWSELYADGKRTATAGRVVRRRRVVHGFVRPLGQGQGRSLQHGFAARRPWARHRSAGAPRHRRSAGRRPRVLVHVRADRFAARPDRALPLPVDGLQAPPESAWSFHLAGADPGRGSCGAASAARGSGEDHQAIHQAGNSVDAPLRSRDRGAPHLSG